jgi:hypothetical protein
MIGVKSRFNKGSKFAFSIVLGLEKSWIKYYLFEI